MKLVIYKGKGRQPWRWRLEARNGKIVADGAEGYATRNGVTKAAVRLCSALDTVKIVQPS